MHDGVLHDRLQREFRQFTGRTPAIAVHLERNAFAEPQFLQRYVVAQQRKLTAERYHTVVMVERVAEEVRQPHYHIAGDGRLLDSGHVGHALQRVEQEMRIDLALQLRKAALLDELAQACGFALLLSQGFFQLCFAFQRVNRPRDLVLEVIEGGRQHADLVRAGKVEVLDVVLAVRDTSCAAAHLLHRQQQAARVIQHRTGEQHAADRGYDGEYHIL